MSYWINNFSENFCFKSLNDNILTEICIVGAGITGLTIAYYLTKKGFKVTIVDKDSIFSKTSGNTTGKITSQHGLFYDYLSKNYGLNFAKDYLQANEQAICNIKNIIDTEKIKCDLIKSSSYVYCDKKSNLTLFNQEISTLNQIKNDFEFSVSNDLNKNGIPFNAKFIKKLNIPLKNFGGIEFENQAMFNPRKYAFGLVKSILKNNGTIYENSCVTNIKFNKNHYNLEVNGKNINVKYVVLATHFPIKNFPGMYFLKMHQDISYVIAIKTKENTFSGYYINSSSPEISIRKVYDKKGENIVLIAGNGHRVGKTDSHNNSYKFLEKIADSLFNDYKIISRWSTQDCISLDKLPYIGNFSKLLSNIYVATGFKKWGMTLSNIAGTIISDRISGFNNKYEYLFTPSRMQLFKNSKAFCEELKESFFSIGINKLKIPDSALKDIDKDNGKIILYNGKKVGVYRNKNDEYYFVNPICTHLKCELQFNNSDKTWDCPCHGSRFAYNGILINNPAIFNLKCHF